MAESIPVTVDTLKEVWEDLFGPMTDEELEEAERELVEDGSLLE